MDLRKLINTQEENSITFSDLQRLLAHPNNHDILQTIRDKSNYTFSTANDDTFTYFDTFIQVILSITYEESNYLETKSIVVISLRHCINSLLKTHGLVWLTEYSHHFSARTWMALRTNSDCTILVYLYGLVLALLNKPQAVPTSTKLIKGLLQFLKSDSYIILVHLWLNFCCQLEGVYDQDVLLEDEAKDMFLKAVEERLESRQLTPLAINQVFKILKNKDAELVADQVDKELGSALARPPFTKDELTIGFICLENACLNRSNQYFTLKRVYHEFMNQDTLANDTSSLPKHNPLLNQSIASNSPADKYTQAQLIRKGTLFWIQAMSKLTPQQFDTHLKQLILHHYPADQKTVLDLLLADWTARDRFHRHLDLVIETLLVLFRTHSYNKRTAPFYAFIQLFHIPDEHQQQQQQNNNRDEAATTTQQLGTITTANVAYQTTRSGAYIDLSQFSNCSDKVLLYGCCLLLQKMTLHEHYQDRKVQDWVADCLKSASPEIVERYFGWLAKGLNAELASSKRQVGKGQYEIFMRVALKTCVSLSSYAVPVLLETFSLDSLEWLLRPNVLFASILEHYFDDGPQVSKRMLVQTLFLNKEKRFIDLLLGYLRSTMAGTDPKQPKSRAWFGNHFLGVILTLVGQDATGQSVASCIFRQLFKTRDDFEWYFSTPLVSAQQEQISFKPLLLSSAHTIYAVKNTGLAAMLQEMVRLGDTDKKNRLAKIWLDLWTSGGNNKLTVPVSWVLQCAGLYDQAPVLVKQLIKQLVQIGILEQSEPDMVHLTGVADRQFLQRIMDLVLLSDAPEPDNLFELVLDVACNSNAVHDSTTTTKTTFREICTSIIDLLIELSEEIELEIELNSSSNSNKTPSRSRPPKLPRKAIRRHKMPKNKLRILMQKHEQKVADYLLQEAQKKRDGDNSNSSNDATYLPGLTVLVQRIINFLLRLLNNTGTTVDTVVLNGHDVATKQDVQYILTAIPLFYEPLGKLNKLIRKPEDLQEDIQTTIDLSLESLKKTQGEKMFEMCQKIASGGGGGSAM